MSFDQFHATLLHKCINYINISIQCVLFLKKKKKKDLSDLKLSTVLYINYICLNLLHLFWLQKLCLSIWIAENYTHHLKDYVSWGKNEQQ